MTNVSFPGCSALVALGGALLMIVRRRTVPATGRTELLGSRAPRHPCTDDFRYQLTLDAPLDLMVPFDGIWSLYISVGQVEDLSFSSGVLIDNVRLRNVPEPGGLLLLLIGATGIAWARRRKQ